jgi:adenylate cyclase
MQRFFKILADGVERFEGFVDKFTGDGIMALFGAPIAHEDHARRACYAALHLRDELREFGNEVKRRSGVDFAVRIGLNSGDVVVGSIGDDLRMEYTAQGHTVGLAQRMESLAAGGSIYVSAATADLVRGFFELDDLGCFNIKGASEALRVHQLQRASAVHTQFELAKTRGLSEFVGRTNEISLLDTSLKQAFVGPGRTVGVVAEAGTGKSRLCYEFVERCRARGIPVYEARGIAHGTQVPFLPAIELTRSFFGIDTRDEPRVAREKIAGRVLLLDDTLREDLPILFDMLEVPDPERPMPSMDADARKRRLYATIRRLAQVDGDRHPSVVFIDDMHWVDEASDAFIEQVIEGNALSKSLVVVNFRPEYRARWMQQSHYQQISLLPLSEDALGSMLRDLLGDHPSVEALGGTIFERTAGNPFFIEEVLRSLVDAGYLKGVRGAYTLVSSMADLPIPQSVHAVLSARIDRLAPREKQVLQAASAIARTFQERLLAHTLDLPASEVGDALRRLQDGEFLYETALYPERELTFKHPLTQEVAGASQLTEQRTRAHARVAQAIEELDADHLDDRAALLAQHWESAGEPRIAAHWHARAGDRVRTTDYAQAFTHWRRVEQLLRDVDTDADAEASTLLGRSFGELLLLMFRVGVQEDFAADVLARGRTFHEARGDHRSLAALLAAYGALLQTQGDLCAYLECEREAMAIARRANDDVACAGVAVEFCWASIIGGELETAHAAADAAIALAGDDITFGADISGYSPLLLCRSLIAYAPFLMGRVADAYGRLERAWAMIDSSIPAETQGWMNLPRIEMEVARGDLDAAERVARLQLALAPQIGSQFEEVSVPLFASPAYLARGQWQKAWDLLDTARRLGCERRCALDIVNVFCWAPSLARAGLGDLDGAAILADEAVSECRAKQARVSLARAHLTRAVIARLRGKRDVASGDLDDAERLIEQTGARLFLPVIYEQRGLLSSDETERERWSRAANELYDDMGNAGIAAYYALGPTA